MTVANFVMDVSCTVVIAARVVAVLAARPVFFLFLLSTITPLLLQSRPGMVKPPQLRTWEGIVKINSVGFRVLHYPFHDLFVQG